MSMGIGSIMSGMFSAPATSTGASSPARNSGAAKAVDEFNALTGKTQAERLKALKFAQMGLKQEDRKAIDPRQREMEAKLHQKMHEAAHAADPTKVGLVVDIKA